MSVAAGPSFTAVLPELYKCLMCTSAACCVTDVGCLSVVVSALVVLDLFLESSGNSGLNVGGF